MRNIFLISTLILFLLSSCIKTDTNIVIDTDFSVTETAVIDLSELVELTLSMWWSLDDVPNCDSIVAEFYSDDNIYNADHIQCRDLWDYVFETLITGWNIRHIIQQEWSQYIVNLSLLTWETTGELDEMWEVFLDSLVLNTQYRFPYQIIKTDFGTIWEDWKILSLNIDDFKKIWNNNFTVVLTEASQQTNTTQSESLTFDISSHFTIKDYILLRNDVFDVYGRNFIDWLAQWLEQMESAQQSQILKNISSLSNDIKTNHRHAVLIQYIEFHIYYLNL